MSKVEFDSLQTYENFIEEKIKPWAPMQRTVLAAAMAERWLPAYQTFSEDEEWGDPGILRHSLDAVWNTASGRPSALVNWGRLKNQVHEITPHMDDFDANEALCACVIVQYAIQCCTDKNNLMPAVMAALSGLAAARPDLLMLDHVPPKLWKQAAVHKEIDKQLRLLEQINALKNLTNAHELLKPFLSDPQIVGELRAKQKTAQVPKGRTNRDVYKQYCQIIQVDTKVAGLNPKDNPDLETILYLSAWMARYSRRKQILSGEYGRLADQTAVTLLLGKNRLRDQANLTVPAWDTSTRATIDMFYENTFNGIDAKSLEDAHGYGPSLRWLWGHAKQNGLSDEQAWASIEAWAQHQPASPTLNNGNKNRTDEVQAAITQTLHWTSTGDPEIPWALGLEGKWLQVRLNDFPDEPMYSLLVDGESVGDFHDWPKTWEREELATDS